MSPRFGLDICGLPYFLAYKTHRPIRRTVIFSLGILEKNNDECILILVIYWKKTGLLHILLQESKAFTSSDARLYNSCTGIYKFGNNTYPRRIRRRSNLGHIFREKSVSYGPGNTLIKISCHCPESKHGYSVTQPAA
jgi:hypothetical protein